MQRILGDPDGTAIIMRVPRGECGARNHTRELTMPRRHREMHIMKVEEGAMSQKSMGGLEAAGSVSRGKAVLRDT